MTRPTSYTPALADEICERLASGETLRDICRDDHVPSFRSVYRWRESNAEFSARFALAREIGGDVIAEQALAIADTPQVGERDETTHEGFKTVREDMLGHRKLQVETRLKLLAVWFPRKYGQRIDMTTAGESLNLTPEQRQAKITQLAAAAEKRRKQAEQDDGTDLV